MSSASSTSDSLAHLDDHYVSDTHYTEDINRKMRVPKRIRVGGEQSDDFPNGMIDCNWANAMNKERFDMQVPERIIVGGYGQRIGTKALPREIMLENQTMPPDPGLVRVATPPKTITLDKAVYPSGRDPPYEPSEATAVVRPKLRYDLNGSDMNISHRDSIAPIGIGGEGLSTGEEVLHLRKQLAKLNRRVMAIELENLQRQQKEKFIYGIGLAYFLLKAIIWLNK